MPEQPGYSETMPLGVILPTSGASSLTNQIFPSPPTVMPSGNWEVGKVYSVITPEVEILPTLSGMSVNQRLPSGPETICRYPVSEPNSVTIPDVVILPMC